jgi:Domain of unknown function (DUF1707)
VLVMPESEDYQVARHARQSCLRVSNADREQVIDTLKDAFVQDRLTKDEFDARVGHALASRTDADLAALTSDLPAGLPAARPPRKAIKPRPEPRPENTTVKNGARVIAATTVLTGAVWAGAWQNQTDSQVWSALVLTFTLVWVGIVIFAGAVMLESRRRRRPGGQLPPTPDDRGQDGRQVEGHAPLPCR